MARALSADQIEILKHTPICERRKLAASFGVHYCTLYRALHRAGIPTRPYNTSKRIPSAADIDNAKAFLQEYEVMSRADRADLAERMGVSRQRLYNKVHHLRYIAYYGWVLP